MAQQCGGQFTQISRFRFKYSQRFRAEFINIGYFETGKQILSIKHIVESFERNVYSPNVEFFNTFFFLSHLD